MNGAVDTRDVKVVAAALASDKSTARHLAPLPPLAEVYRRHATDVARWAARLGGPLIDVDDVVQEVFIVVNRQLPHFRGEAKVTTWLFRITDRVVRNHRRWRAVRRIVTRLTARHNERLISGDADPLEALERHAAAREAYLVLDQLPEKYRRVLILSELESLPADEIARLLGAPIATVRVWLHRARRMFLDRVGARAIGDDEDQERLAP
jgi:RNA polymerase sigma-70 factor (ECF subfamily)